ncbi:MAG: hypothetical protein JRJ49_00005 [Deltaproteobacteria bacterium]|nr:hypothetical protein [Deltaproteobacteria bacterium]
MPYRKEREELSLKNRLRRSYYELLTDDLEQTLLQYGLVDSYKNFLKQKTEFPFVQYKELKPRVRIPSIEYKEHNPFLVIFTEDFIPSSFKKYLKFFDINKTTKSNLINSGGLCLLDNFDRTHKYLESPKIFNFLTQLLSVDYATLIQRDKSIRSKSRYHISHFHVRIDWPVVNAAEELAKSLRYVSQDIYEKGDRYAEIVQRKFFEYYGMHPAAGGRRTAAIIAAQYLRKLPCISGVYVSSSESRALLKLTEKRISKAVLVKLTDKEAEKIAQANSITLKSFKKNYSVVTQEKDEIYIFCASYAFTEHALPPEDGKLREIKHDVSWLKVDCQYILPKPGTLRYSPLPVNLIYAF